MNHPNIINLIEVVTSGKSTEKKDKADSGRSIYMVFEAMSQDLTGKEMLVFSLLLLLKNQTCRFD